MKRNWSCTEAVIRKFSVKKVFLENWQNSQENACAGVSFLKKLQASTLQFYLKIYSGTGVFKNTFLIEHLRANASKYNVTFKELFSLIEFAFLNMLSTLNFSFYVKIVF